MRSRTLAIAILAMTLSSTAAFAQTLGTFRWQLQPYCNVVSLTVVFNSGGYTLDGFDDQCGAGQRAAAAGTAFLNPDGSIGIGLAIVTAPAGTPVHVDVALNLSTLNGTWHDSAGGSGAFVSNPASASGSPRPAPVTAFPAGLSAGGHTIAQVATPINPADAATKQYVDAVMPPSSQFTFLADGGLQATGTSATVSAFPAATNNRRLLWLPGKGAFRAGTLDADDAEIGPSSAAFGYLTVASGLGSFAAGDRARATNHGSVAMGRESYATGNAAVALGSHTGACGHFGVALGLRAATATSPTDVNPCAGTIHNGVFIFSSYGPTTYFPSVTHGEFAARAIGGFRFRTNADATTGCNLPAGSGAFACSSDVHLKRDFAPLDGESVLARVAGIPVTTWSFVEQDGVRHAGPMAQDFRAAFGLGENDTSISYTDINGINMRAIQALEQRTRDLSEKIASLEAELARLRGGQQR